MKITFVLPYAGLQGGVRVVAIYAAKLQQRGHEVTVISMPPVISLRSRIKSLALGHGWNITNTSYFDSTKVQNRVLDRSREVTDSDVPDADVIVATYYTTAFGVQKLSAAKGAKAIFIQNYEVEEGKPNPLLDATWKMPMHKITIAQWLVALAQDRFDDSIVSIVPNSVDLNQFSSKPRVKQAQPTVGLLYSTFSLKGCVTSIKALRAVAKAKPSIRLIAFGAERPDFRLPLPRFAEFHYRPAQDRLRELYSRCDVWMCGSNVEGFHLPPLEAMACRCPVVSTRVGGPMDIIEDGVNGYLVDTKDIDALADRTLRVLDMREQEWRLMSDAAYSTATRFSWDDATTLFEQALLFAIERDHRGDWRRVKSSSKDYIDGKQSTEKQPVLSR